MLLLTLLLGASSLAGSPALLPCATPILLMEQARPLPLPANPPEEGPKSVRNSYPATTNSLETENFVLWWGSSASPTVSMEDASALLESFELAWITEIETLGFTQPQSTESYKFNVYLGDTGGPSSLGANGYYFYDDDDWPMIVIASDLLGTDEAFVTAAHEFFHAIQDSTGTYIYAGDAAWYFEATAVWSEAKVHPGTTEYVKFIPSLAFLPHLPINYFDYPDSLDLEEYHHYGASLFIKHLDEVYGPSLIQRSWEEASLEADPLEVLQILLDEQESSVEEAFFEFFDRNGTWNYPDEAAIEAELDASGGYDDPASKRPTGQLRIPVQTNAYTNTAPPFSYGGNYWRLHDVTDTFYLKLTPHSQGGVWHISVMTQREDIHTVEAYTFQESEPLTFTGHAGADEIWLGIATVSEHGQFTSYALDISQDLSMVEEGSSRKQCGCSTSPSQSGWMFFLLLCLHRRYSCLSMEKTHLETNKKFIHTERR